MDNLLAQPTIVLIIQARMGSTRLPGKSMMDLAGAPLIGRIIERVKRAKKINKIVLATTKKSEDDILEEVALQSGIYAFRGSENDLVDRYYQAAKAFNANIVLRLPADNPIPEPSEYDRIIEYHLRGESEFSSNITQINKNGYPDGIGAEVFNFNVLEEIWQRCTDSQKRKHLALNFYDYCNQKAVDSLYRVGTIDCPVEFSRPDLVLDVNTYEEYKFIREIYEYLYPKNPDFHIIDVIKWYDNIYLKKAGKYE